MPHASKDTMSKPTVNGEKPSSQTLNHVSSYPLVSDALKIYTSNSIGAKSIELFHNLYHTFAEPVFPYLQTPYSIVSPYLAKADSIGNSSLDTVDEHFPAIKSTNLDSLKSTISSIAGYPFKVASEGRDYVFSTYADEYKKTGGEGVVTTGKAIVSTELRITSEAIHAVADFIKPQKDKLEAQAEKLKSAAAEKYEKTKKGAQEKQNHVKEQVNSK